jgi:C4-dicarboxylate-specific signal transduction histidine kinase
MLSSLFADTPAWVDDAKNWAGLIASFVGAFGLVWRYAIKPFLEHREAERKRDLADAAALRKGEITAALIPLQEQIKLQQTDVNRVGDKLIMLGDAVSGVNVRLNALQTEQESLHRAVLEHMQTEDAKRDGH